MTPLETVQTFIKHIEAKDIESALALCTDDIEYDNVPMPTAHGKDEVRQFLGPFIAGAGRIEWVTHREAETGDIVMNERTDRFEMGDRWLEIPVVGVWELRDGLIALWRDYFDLGQFNEQLAG
jgi:limonene-1,2-epoxide hydrolase